MKKTADQWDQGCDYAPGEKHSRSGRKVFKWSQSKLPAIFIALLLLYVVFAFGSQFNRLYTMQQDIRHMQAEVKELRERNADLREQVKMLQSDAYVESIARERLGLVKPGESRILPVGDSGVGVPGAANELNNTYN